MTLSMAGLAVSAVLLSSSSALIQRYYDKDRDYRLMARAAIGRTKATVQRDTTLSIPFDTAYRAMTAQALSDASGSTIGTIRVNSYATYTGDTAGTFIPFLTIMAQAYDTLGTRSVQRLDLQSESFSRYAIFVDTFLPNTVMDTLMHIRGRVHGNRNWYSAVSTYYDTMSLSGSTHSGSATYSGNGVAVTGAKRIKWPTSSSLSNLSTLASAGNLSFTQLSATSATSVNSGGVDVSGDATAAATARRGTRLRFRPVDVNGNGEYDAAEGFFMVFDLASGMDTSNFRADLTTASSERNPATLCPASGSGSDRPCQNTVILNNCGLMVTISGRKEFFPVNRFRESWVQTRVQLSTAPIVSAADAAIMGGTYASTQEVDTVAAKKILSFGYGYSRCFPSGSPYLMLSERYVSGASCGIDSTLNAFPYAWGASASCSSTYQYGGQDTTFTINARRCYIRGTAGQCYDDPFTSGTGDGLQRVGNWVAFGGTSTVPALTTIQDRERPYLWPISTTYNAASRGVIYASNTSALFVSDTVRGFVTLYAHGRVVLVDDLVYDKDPTDPNALCRNMLGVIADTSIKIANSPINFPRRIPSGPSSTTTATFYAFLGSPNFYLHGYMLALSTTTSTSSTANRLIHGTVTAEDSSSNAIGGLTCKGISTSGGCWFHTGGAAMKIFHESMAAAGTGLLRMITADPCQAQQTNRRPPFFPLTGRYLDYKWSEVDTRDTDTWAEIKTYLARLRGNNRAVP
jgi:hypothetical protein